MSAIKKLNFNCERAFPDKGREVMCYRILAYIAFVCQTLYAYAIIKYQDNFQGNST